ncbi:uncharacterized protein LOC134269136 [Saccostrea cucullata]|uniref:uncharacterized protein LOC134269136 n=1 Tax=Saccostrea cuccullata TaxID=36930 RepID=UPI002ED2100A
MRKFKKHLRVHRSNLNPSANIYSNQNENSQIEENSQSRQNFSENSRAHQSLTSVYSNPNSGNFHKLPKLNLPIFEGNVLEWQSFWDSFDSAIHSNNTLTEVQKFNYLKSLVADEASNTISGFALTHANYNRAIELLHERFGQKHKITQSYMQALLDLPTPKNNLTSLRHFHDQVETYVRGLESYGQAQDTYGSLLVPVILNKLPTEIRNNSARENGSTDWLLGDLRNSLYRELEILEAGAGIAAHNAVKTNTRNTHGSQAKAELDAKTREIKNLQDEIKNYKSVIATLKQQISEQRILTEKTMKDVIILQTQFAKLQAKFHAQSIATKQMTTENQAEELKKKEVEVNTLRQIQRLKSSRETPGRKLQQVGGNIHSDLLQQRETPRDQITSLKRKLEVSKKLDNVHKNNLEQRYREENQEKINIMNQKEKERIRFTKEASNLTQNYADYNKVHGMQIGDFKRISGDDTNIRQQENTFKTLRDVERTYSKNLIES